MSTKIIHVKVDDALAEFERVKLGVGRVTNTAVKRVAGDYRDAMKKNYQDETHKSAYGRRAVFPQSSPKSMSSFLVVSESYEPGVVTVGPKSGGMYTSADSSGKPTNMQSYEDIFNFQIQGYKGKAKTFRLRPDRQGASDDGLWTVREVKPKRFADKTFKEFTSGGLEVSTRIHVEPLIRKELNK